MKILQYLTSLLLLTAAAMLLLRGSLHGVGLLLVLSSVVSMPPRELTRRVTASELLKAIAGIAAFVCIIVIGVKYSRLPDDEIFKVLLFHPACILSVWALTAWLQYRRLWPRDRRPDSEPSQDARDKASTI